MRFFSGSSTRNPVELLRPTKYFFSASKFFACQLKRCIAIGVRWQAFCRVLQLNKRQITVKMFNICLASFIEADAHRSSACCLNWCVWIWWQKQRRNDKKEISESQSFWLDVKPPIFSQFIYTHCYCVPHSRSFSSAEISSRRKILFQLTSNFVAYFKCLLASGLGVGTG